MTIWATNLRYKGETQHPFLINPNIRQMAKEAGITYIRLRYTEDINIQKTVAIATKIKDYGFKPFVVLSYHDMTFNQSLVTQLKGICDLYEIGNEPHVSNAQTGLPTPSEYAQFFNIDVPLLRAIDPDAKFGGPACGSVFDTWGNSKQFMDEFLAQCTPNADYCSFHTYAVSNYTMLNNPPTKEQVLNSAYSRYKSQIDNLKSRTQLPIIVSEFNWDGWQQNERWDLDPDFIKPWTKITMESMSGAYMGVQWYLATVQGVSPTLSMIDINGDPKPQIEAFKEVTGGPAPEPEPGPEPAEVGGRLIALLLALGVLKE